MKNMKKEGVKDKITISINKELLIRLDDFCSKTKPVKSNRSPIIEKATEEFLERENGEK
jgi:metal-responsive CopG/Arc/MetJ family transcriptional regulator